MNREELLREIRELFEVYLNDNRALPKYKGLPGMLEKMIELLDGGAGEGTDPELQELKDALEALRTQLAANEQRDEQQDTDIGELKGRVSQLPPRSALEALEQALQNLRTTVNANEQIDTQQSADITQLKNQIAELASQAALEQLKNSLTTLRNDLTANTTHDSAQDDKIAAIETALQELPTSAVLTEVQNTLAKLETQLTANTTHDGEQDTKIDTLRDRLDGLPTREQLARLKATVEKLVTDLATNTTHDGEQDTAIQELKAALENLPTEVVLDEIRQAITDLENGLAANTTADGERDTRLDGVQSALTANEQMDTEQSAAIAKLQEDLLNIPSSAALEALQAKLEALQSALAENTTHDGEQDDQLAALKAALEALPNPETLGELRDKVQSLLEDLAANTTHDGEQDAAIAELKTALENVPTEVALGEIHAAIAELQTGLTANTDHDGEQDATIAALKDKVDGLPEPTVIDDLQAALEQLQTGLTNLENSLDANTQKDAEQDTEIAQIKEDILGIPTDAALRELRDQILVLQRNLSGNITRDDAQDEKIRQIELELEGQPSDTAIRTLREAIEAIQAALSNNVARDDQQESDILALRWEVENNYATLQALEEINAALTAVEAGLAGNTERDDAQDAAIAELTAKVENIATEDGVAELREDLAENKRRDDRQDTELERLRNEIADIPTEAGLQTLRDAIAALEEELGANTQADTDRADRITTLETWRTTIEAALERLQTEQPDLDQLKSELQAEIAAVKADCEAKLAPLTGLPDRVAALETRLDELTNGLDEAAVRNIAREEVEVLRQALEARLQALEDHQTAQPENLGDRLEKAEGDIVKLFELIGEHHSGEEHDGVSETYVKAELHKLETLLRQEIKAVNDRYLDLLDLPTRLATLQTELAEKTTLAQVNELLAAAVADLVSKADLEALQTDIQAAYELYVNNQLTTYQTQLTELEVKLREEWTLQITTALSAIWEQLGEQEFPEAWQERVREIATALDETLKTDILAQVRNWDDELRTLITEGDQAVETNILNQITENYITQTDLEAEKESLLELLRQELQTALGELPPILTEAAVKTLAEQEAARLDEALSARIAALEALDLDTKIEQLLQFQTTIEGLDLAGSISFVQQLRSEDIITLVHSINIWKQEAGRRFDTLAEQVDALTERLDDYTDDGVGDRLSRVCNTGWGPMGGMEIHSDNEHCLHVSAGRCITPDGQVVGLVEDAAFASYCLLEDEHELKQEYPYFADIPVWRMVSAKPGEQELEDADTNTAERRWLTPQNNRERDEPFIADKTVLVLPGPVFYLVRIQDYLEKEGKTKTVRGIVERDRDFEDADYKFSSIFSSADDLPDSDVLYRAFNPAYSLPTIPLYRFGFRPHDDCTTEELDKTDFPEELTELTHLYDTWKPIVEDALTEVNHWVGQLLTQYGETLFPQMPQEDFRDTLEILLANWTTFKRFAERDGGSIERCYVQYFYDWARDLIRAYHECRYDLQDLMAEVCLLTPDTLSERHAHVSLGPAWQVRHDGLAAPLRDAFHQPPVYNGNARRWERTRVYFRRIFELIESFYLAEALPNERLPQKFRQESEDEDPFKPDFMKVKIVPSRNLGAPLGRQTIPFYYPLTEGDGSLQYYWEYRKTRNRWYNQHLSYHASDGYESYNDPDDWHVTRPLYFALDDADFYRVEGHLNRSEVVARNVGAVLAAPQKTYSVIQAIQYLMHKHNLDCSVVTLEITRNLAEEVGDLSPTYSFRKALQGAEHLGGVPRGGTLILITEKDEEDKDRVIADFAIPYRMTQAEVNAIPGPTTP